MTCSFTFVFQAFIKLLYKIMCELRNIKGFLGRSRLRPRSLSRHLLRATENEIISHSPEQSFSLKCEISRLQLLPVVKCLLFENPSFFCRYLLFGILSLRRWVLKITVQELLKDFLFYCFSFCWIKRRRIKIFLWAIISISKLKLLKTLTSRLIAKFRRIIYFGHDTNKFWIKTF